MDDGQVDLPKEGGSPRFSRDEHYLAILPFVRVPRLASWILGRVLRRLSVDWQNKYGHPILLVETFVERERFAGTSSKAANWLRLGPTAGRSRQNRRHTLQVPFKDVYLDPSPTDSARNSRHETSAERLPSRRNAQHRVLRSNRARSFIESDSRQRTVRPEGVMTSMAQGFDGVVVGGASLTSPKTTGTGGFEAGFVFASH
jgi:hypothetical protein